MTCYPKSPWDCPVTWYCDGCGSQGHSAVGEDGEPPLDYVELDGDLLCSWCADARREPDPIEAAIEADAQRAIAQFAPLLSLLNGGREAA